MRKTASSLVAIAIATGALTLAQPAAAQAIGWITTYQGAVDYPQTHGNIGYANTGAGQYQVVFYGLGNSFNSNVEITAMVGGDGTPRYCSSGGWYSSNGTDVNVNVDCYNAAGAPTNADFTALYQSRSGALSSGVVAFLWADQPTTASYTPSATYSYNSTGVANVINRDNVGLYFAYLPGVNRNGGNPIVTAYGGAGARCEVVDWYHNLSGTNVVVQCVNAAGAPADEYFDLSFAYGTSHGVGAGTTHGGYAWADNTTGAHYVPPIVWQYQNTSATRHITVQNSGVGGSFMNLPIDSGLILGQSLGLLTAMGSKGEYCDLLYPLGYYGSARHETLTMTVNSFNAQGQPLSDQYTGAFVATP